jgi:hypothetical protein
MTSRLNNWAQNFLRVLLGLSLLASASAQTITPLYGASGGFTNLLSQGSAEGAAIAPLDLTSRPGWVVTAACNLLDQNQDSQLLLAVWKDTGTALVEEGSHTASSLNCTIGLAVVSLENTNAQGITTVVAATVSITQVLTISAWQVSSSGAISPLGTPVVDTSSFLPLGVAITSLPKAHRVVTTVNPSAASLKVATWNIPSTGDITELDSVFVPNLTGIGSVTYISSTEAVTADLGANGNDMYVTSWGIDGFGNLTQISSAMVACTSPGVPTIARYLLGSNPQVITACNESLTNIRVNTWGVTEGVVTLESTLIRPSMPESPAISYIPGDDLPFATEYGGNNVFDALVFYQPASTLEELASYHTTWVNYFPLSQGVAPENTHRVVTAEEDFDRCGSAGCELELEVWYFDSD